MAGEREVKVLLVLDWVWVALPGYSNSLEFSLLRVLVIPSTNNIALQHKHIIIKISFILLIHLSSAVSDNFGAIFVEKV